jgi:transposase
LEECAASRRVEPNAFIRDKGNDSDALVEKLEQRGITPVIPPKANRNDPRETDFALYCERNLVERFFNALKHYRGIATPTTSSPIPFSLAFCWSARDRHFFCPGQHRRACS